MNNYLQQLFGRNYKWWYLTKINYKVASSTIHISIINVFALIIQSIAIVWVWKIAGTDSSIFTYLVVGRIFKSLIDTYCYYLVGSEILSGKISTHLLRPSSQSYFNFFRNFGRRASANLIQFFGSLIVLLLCYAFISPVKLDLFGLIFLLTLTPIAFLVNYLSGYIVGLMSFFVKDEGSNDAVKRVYESLNLVLVGTLIPLDKMPFSSFFSLLPYSWILHHPMQIYLGKYDFNQTILVFAGGIAWCVILFFFAKIIFKAGLKRNEAVGL